MPNRSMKTLLLCGACFAAHAAVISETDDEEDQAIIQDSKAYQTGSFHDVFEFHEESLFWNAAGNLIADTLMKRAKPRGGTDSLMELDAEEAQQMRVDAARRQALQSELETGTGGKLGAQLKEELECEDALVQKVVKEALGVHEVGFRASNDTAQSLLMCARRVGRHGKDEEEGKDDEKDDGKKDKGEEVQGDQDIQDAVANSNETKKKEDNVLMNVWNLVKPKLTAQANFWVNELKWEVFWWVFGGSVVDVPALPIIGWKCQPLHGCIKQIAKAAASLFDLLGTMIWAIGKVFWEMLKKVGKFLGGLGKKKDKSASLMELFPTLGQEYRPEEGSLLLMQGNKDWIQSEYWKPSDASGEPDESQIQEFAKAHNTQVIADHQTVDNACGKCSVRMKGGFQLSFVAPPSMGVFVTTCPTPASGLLGALKGCMGCVNAAKDYLVKQFAPSVNAGKLAKEYFKAGTCHANSLGLCMLLEKTRGCGLKFESSSIKNEPGTKKGSSSQKKVCDAFKGIQMDMTAVNGEPQCPSVYAAEVKETTGKNVSFNQSSIQKIDLQAGCNQVRDELQRYNRKCESGKSKGSASYVGSRLYSSMTGDFTYKNAENPTSGEQAAVKCRAIFDCPKTKKQDENAPPKDGQIKWDKVQGMIYSIIQKVDDYGETPQAYDPVKATDMIEDLVESVGASIESIEKKVGQAIAAEDGEKTDWGDKLELVFADNMWHDDCFTGLDKAAGLKGAMAAVKKMYDSKNKDFFFQLSDYLQLSEWDPDLKKSCATSDKPREKPELFKPQIAGPKVTLYTEADPETYKEMLAEGVLQLHSLAHTAAYGLRVGKVESKTGGKAQWVLNVCELGVKCSGVSRGAPLSQIKQRFVDGKIVKKFLNASSKMMDLAGTLSEEVANDSMYADYNAAAQFVNKWASEVRDEVISKGTATTMRDVVRLKELQKKLTKTESLQVFCSERGWHFTNPKKSGSLMLMINGAPLDKLRQLRVMEYYLKKPAAAPMSMLSAAVTSSAESLLKGQESEVLWQPTFSDEQTKQALGKLGKGGQLLELTFLFERFDPEAIPEKTLTDVGKKINDKMKSLKKKLGDKLPFHPEESNESKFAEAMHKDEQIEKKDF